MSTSRELLFLVITVALLVLLGLDRFFLTPMVEKTTELKQEREQLEAEVLSNLNKLNKRKKLARTWSNWIKTSLQTDPSQAESKVLNAVDYWSREARIDLASIEPERPNQKGTLREIRFQASASGSFGSLIRFLYFLETADFPLRTQRVELKPVKTKDSERLTMNLQFSTIYLASESEPQPGTPPRPERRKS